MPNKAVKKVFLGVIGLIVGLLTTASIVAHGAMKQTHHKVAMNLSQPYISTKCVAPYNIDYVVSPDKKQVTFAWLEYPASDPILNYQINNGADVKLWRSNDKKAHCYSTTLPGKNGTYIFYFYSNCTTGQSQGYKFQVVVS